MTIKIIFNCIFSNYNIIFQMKSIETDHGPQLHCYVKYKFFKNAPFSLA